MFSRLHRKIFTFILIILFIPITIIYTYIPRGYSERLIDLERRNTDEYIHRMYYSIQTNIEIIRLSAQVVLSDKILTSILNKQEVGQKGDTGILLDDLIAIKNNTSVNMQNIVSASPQIRSIRFYFVSDALEEISPTIYRMERISPDIRKKITGNEQELWTFQTDDAVIDPTVPREPYVAYYSRMNSLAGNICGVVEVTVSMDNFLSSMSFSDTDHLIGYMNEEGALYYNYISSATKSNQPWSHYINDLSQFMRKGRDGEASITSLDDMPNVLVQTLAIPHLGGRVFRVVDLSRLMKSVRVMIRNYTLLIILFLIVLAFFIQGGVRQLLKGIYRLISLMRQVEQGTLNIKFPGKSNDEIGELLVHFERMITRIDMLMKANEQKQLVARDSEIKALQNQINAHFLYNTLETIRMMAEAERKHEISDAINSLGNLLRYTMSGLSSVVIVKDEVEYIKNYINLLSLRYDIQIHLVIDIPQPVHNQEICKMSLQPIVENTLIHGTKGRGRDVTIQITAEVNDPEDSYSLIILDDGTGIPKESLERLEQMMDGPVVAEIGGNNGSIGLRNVQNRIKLRFGEKYGVQIASEEGQYTRVEIMLPYHAL